MPPDPFTQPSEEMHSAPNESVEMCSSKFELKQKQILDLVVVGNTFV